MVQTATEKIKTIMDRLGVNNTELAKRTGWSRQNITNKFGRNNMYEKDIVRIADALGCEVEIVFTLPDGRKL